MSNDQPSNPDSSNPDSSQLESSQAVAEERKATAYHEAGHAVMALSLGRDLQKVTIAPANLQTGGLRLGACQIKKGRAQPAHDPLEQQVLILLAGMVAESHFTGGYCERGAAGDLSAARRALATRAKSERQLERLQQRWLDKTEYLLADEELSAAIKQIADQLLQYETISGRAARHIFENVIR